MSAAHMNRATLIGNVGRDPEHRSLQTGSKVVNFTIATSDSWKDKGTGERKQRTEWHRVTIFNDHLAGVALQYVIKGSLVLVEGEIRTRKWTDKNGVEKYATEIVVPKFGGELKLLGGKPEGGDRHSGRDDGAGSGDQGGGDLDDEIPF